MIENRPTKNYFEDAMRIHAICADFDFSENEARLLTYMHAKSSESGIGIDYFLNPTKEDAEALEIMLGRRSGTYLIPSAMTLDDDAQAALEVILSIAERIQHLDAVLASECGLENRLTSELAWRLRLYRDDVFRDRMMFIYKTVILPKLSTYTDENVKSSFDRYRKEKEIQERELMQLVGITD